MQVTQSMIRPFISGESILSTLVNPVIKNVRFDKEKSVFIATNGHILIEWKNDEMAWMLSRSVNLPIEVFPKSKKECRRYRIRGNNIIIAHLDTKKKHDPQKSIKKTIKTEVFPLPQEKTFIGQEYPKTDCLWPETESQAIDAIGFNPMLISAFTSFCHKYGVMVTFYGKTSTIFIEDNWDEREWRGLLMPVRSA